MHLCRILKSGLKALAKAVNITKGNDWGTYIREIRKELNTRMISSGVRSADEQFYSKMVAEFDGLKRAYRNPTMHPDKSYSVERAQEIFQATKSFMNHLAFRLSEIPQ